MFLSSSLPQSSKILECAFSLRDIWFVHEFFSRHSMFSDSSLSRTIRAPAGHGRRRHLTVKLLRCLLAYFVAKWRQGSLLSPFALCLSRHMWLWRARCSDTLMFYEVRIKCHRDDLPPLWGWVNADWAGDMDKNTLDFVLMPNGWRRNNEWDQRESESNVTSRGGYEVYSLSLWPWSMMTSSAQHPGCGPVFKGPLGVDQLSVTIQGERLFWV